MTCGEENSLTLTLVKSRITRENATRNANYRRSLIRVFELKRGWTYPVEKSQDLPTQGDLLSARALQLAEERDQETCELIGGLPQFLLPKATHRGAERKLEMNLVCLSELATSQTLGRVSSQRSSTSPPLVCRLSG